MTQQSALAVIQMRVKLMRMVGAAVLSLGINQNLWGQILARILPDFCITRQSPISNQISSTTTCSKGKIEGGFFPYAEIQMKTKLFHISSDFDS